MKLLLLAGLAYTALGEQCISVQDKNKAKCEAISVLATCNADTDCKYVGCVENPNGSLCKSDTTCYWTGKTCVDNTGCGAAPTKAQCNLKTDTDGFPCGYNTGTATCEKRTCAHSGKSSAWCLKYNTVTGPQCMFLSRQCWDLPSGQDAVVATSDDKPDLKKGEKHCTSDRASKRVKCSKLTEATCLADAADACKWVDNSGGGGGTPPTPPSKCEMTGNATAQETKCKRKKGCKFVGGACAEMECADFDKNQFTCHFKAAKSNLTCVMDGTTCRTGSFSDADMIAKACDTNLKKRVCHAQVKADGGPRCEWNDDDNLCRDAQNKTCGDSNRKECRNLRSTTPGQGCWWLGPTLRCLDNTATCADLPKDRCKKVKKFKEHYGLTCALNRSNDQCYNNQVTCGDVTSGKFCVEHANCSWNGTLCVDYGNNPVALNGADTCQAFNKKTCKTWENNCFWYQGYDNGAGLCVVQPGKTSP